MKNLLMMLSVLTLLGCKAFDPTASADLGAPAAAKAIPSSDATTSNEVIALTNPLDVSGGEVGRGANGNGPLWTIRSEQIAARSQDHSVKTQSRAAKPQGPFTVRYVLERWALDDHRLVVEVQSNQSISDWQVDLPQVIEKQERATRLAKPNIAERGAPEVRTFSFGALPNTNRLLLTVTAKVSDITASKTVSIPLRSSSNPSAKTCDRAEIDCVVVLPATLSRQ
jgi:hypothetical protein